jgi:general stress protein YciG
MKKAVKLGDIQFNEELVMAKKSGTSKRGFASMDESKQREIARKGGRASHGGGRKKST